MATVAILQPAFGIKWAQDGTVEAIEEAQWRAGWSFIGATPPSVEQFNKVHQVQDEKSNYLYAQMAAIFTAAGVTPAAGTTTSLRDALSLLTPGRLLRTSVYLRIAGVQNVVVNGAAPTTSGATTFTKLAGTAYAIIEATGAGGGSGGNLATTAGQHSFSAGGGGGAYGVRYETGAMSGIAVTIGAAGTAGPAASAGGNGGASSFGALLTAPGGIASGTGTINAGISSVGPIAGGAAPTGANLYGMPGGNSGQSVSAALGFVGGGFGGPSGAGTPRSYGAGATGAYAGVSSAVNSPGNAAPDGGIIIVREYA